MRLIEGLLLRRSKGWSRQFHSEYDPAGEAEVMEN